MNTIRQQYACSNITAKHHDKESRDKSRTAKTPALTRVVGITDNSTQLLIYMGSAVITVMSQPLHEQLRRELEPVQHNIISATGHPLVALGSLSVTVSIGPTKYHQPAIACRHVTHDFIIGVDFHKTNMISTSNF